VNTKLILGAVGGLVVGLAGGTGYAIVTKPDAPPAVMHAAADSLAVDSLAAHAAVIDPAAYGAEDGAEHTAPATSTPAHTPAADSAKTPVKQVAATTPPPAPQPQPRATATADSASARLGRIFGAMKPEDAAAVLARLDDAEVRAVLFQLSDRKAAEILARFPGDRAANLTKTLLSDAGSR